MEDFSVKDHQQFALEKKVSKVSKGLKITWVILALLALGLIPGFIALARTGDDDDDDNGNVAVTAQTSESRDVGTSGDSASTLLSISGTAPEGYTARGALNGGSGSWLNRASFPAPGLLGMSDGSAVTVGEKIYHIGGYLGNATAGNVLSDSVFVYDSLLDTFTTGPNLPVPAARGGAVYDGQSTIYYVGGITTGNGHFASGACLFSLDTKVANATWTSLPCMETPASDMCTAWADNKLYVIGGYDSTFDFLDTINIYDPQSSTWTVSDMKMPTARGDAHCVTLSDVIYVVGGVDNFDSENNTQSWFTSDVVAVDVVAKTTTTRAPLPGKPRGDIALAAVSASSMLAAGGEIGVGDRTLIGIHDVYLYNAVTNTWVSKAPMPGARFRATASAATVHDGSQAVMVFGGHHRCESKPDFSVAADDGGCDEIAPVAAFFDTPTTPVYVYEQAQGGDGSSGIVQEAIVSLLPAVPGYRYKGPLSAGAGFWASKSNLASPRSDFHAHTIGDKIYLVGGLSGAGATLHQIDVYDPVLDIMEPGSTFSTQQFRMRYASGAVDGKILIAGGLEEDSGDGHLNTLLIWDPSTKNYTSGPPLETARSDACGAAAGGKLYVMGGWPANYTSTLQSVEVYDPATQTWSAGPPLPEPRGDCMATAVDGVVYVAGGFHDPSNEFQPDSFHTTLYALDTRVAAPQWEVLAPAPVARGDGALVALDNDRILMIGGETNVQGGTQVATHDVSMYLIKHNIWVPKAPIPQARFRFAAATHNGIAHTFGGHATCGRDMDSQCSDTAHNSIEAFFEAASEPYFLHIKS